MQNKYNKFDNNTEGFRHVVALTPIKKRIRRLEVCVTDRVAIFKDFATPVFWGINAEIKKKDGVHLRVLFPGETVPRVLPIEQVRLYNNNREDDREFVSEYNSYASDITAEKDRFIFDPRDWDARFRYLRYLYRTNKIWRQMRKFRKIHLVGTNASMRWTTM